MANQGFERTVRLSVLDRLIDREPRTAADPPTSFDQSVRELKATLLRDLEWLFNTRRIAVPPPPDLAELSASLYSYGLADITSLSGDSEMVRRQLTRDLENAVRAHEPRLDDIRVTLLERDDENRRSIRFVIEALLRMEPNPERVVFDTVLETSSGTFSIDDESDA